MIDQTGNDLDTKRVFLVKQGIFGGGWVCAPKWMSQRQVQEAIWDHVPQYVPGSAWIAVKRKHEIKEMQSPGLCGECNDRQHWLVLGGLSGFLVCGWEGMLEEQDPEFHRIRGDTLGYEQEVANDA